jgi:hypothetical protein
MHEVTSTKPKSLQSEIPLGVKFTDSEITNGIALKLVLSLQECAKGESEGIRMMLA